MGLEYCDAIIYQAKVHQAKKVYEDDEMTVEDSVKSAMSPFLVLEVRRDHLIEDTLVQVKLKVIFYINIINPRGGSLTPLGNAVFENVPSKILLATLL